jgi:heterodisulfide reductase subunit A-like polyferredoxin
MAQAGLNPHLLEMTNIREHCSWVHSDPEMATGKSQELVAMTVAKSRLLEPIPAMKIDVDQTALVMGGGVAGMTAALSLGDQGYRTIIVEKEKKLGGMLGNLSYTVEGIDVKGLLSDLESRIEENDNIQVFTSSVVSNIKGYVGNYDVEIGGKEYRTGAIIVAAGSTEHVPSSYGYGEDDRIVTLSELEHGLEKVDEGETFVMIQCVESREGDRNYCSRTCCMGSLKNALKIKELNPRAEVYILYRDLMTYGFWERYYKQARELGVIFMQYSVEEKPEVEIGDKLKVRVLEPMLQEEIEIDADHLVLATGMDPVPDREEIAKQLKVPLNHDGFFLEAHVKLRPVDFSTRGVFLAGSCHTPKFIGESVYQAQAAAARAATILSSPTLEAEPNIAVVDVDMCSGCKTCISLCPYNAIDSVTEVIDGVEVTHAQVNEGLCQGCGTCVAACPSGAMHQRGFKDDQLLSMVRAIGSCGGGN